MTQPSDVPLPGSATTPVAPAALPSTLIQPTPSDPESTLAYRPSGAAAPPKVPLPEVSGYALEGILGRGGMGIVYRARHLALNRIVALKMILGGDHALEEERLRFKAEAEVVARLQHPHIVQVFEVGETDGRPYCALEFVAGGSLASKLARAPLPPTEAARLVELLAQAMQAAHARGVVHRDLKPANVLLAADGSPKITDFGLARLLDVDSGQTRSGQVLGTPCYMAPEQAAGLVHAVGPAADVYALGALLYECLTGRPPFRGTTSLETLEQVRSQEPVRVRQLQPKTPGDLETVCHKCLEKEPARRYTSADDLANDLRRFLDGLPVRARPVGPLGRLTRWRRRNPIVAGLLSALLVLLAATAVGSGVAALYFRQQADSLQTALNSADENWNKSEENRKQAVRERDLADESRQRTERALGVSRLAQSVTAWRERNVFLARSLCEDVPPEVRSWEWRYLRQQYTGGLFTCGDRLHEANCLAFHPRGNFLASGGKDGFVRFWDAADGHALQGLKGHTGTVSAVAFSPGGDRLASAGQDRQVLIRSSESGAVLHSLEGHGADVLALAWGPDGKQLASASADRTVRIWDTATGETNFVLAGHENRVKGVAFNPDGRLVASASDDGTVRLWDAHSGAAGRTFETDGRALHAVCFSPDGRTLAAGGRYQLIRLWDVGTGAEIRTVDQVAYKGAEQAPVSFEVTGLCYSPDGRQLASCCGAVAGTKFSALDSDTAIHVWEPDSGQLLFTCAAHTGMVRGLSYSPDGRRLASVTWGTGEIKVWDVRTSPEHRAGPAHECAAVALCFSPDGRRLATAAGDPRFKSNPDGVLLSDAATGRVERALPHPWAVLDVAFSPDGTHLATGCQDGIIRIWEVRTGQVVRTLTDGRTSGRSVCYSADGTYLASAGGDRAVRVWEAESGRLLRTYQRQEAIYSVCYGRAGHLAAGGQGSTAAGEVLLWRPGEDEPQVLPGHTGPVTCVRFSPDGRRLASASWDKTVRIRDVAVGGEGLLLRGHTGLVAGVAFSSDGHRVASCDSEGVVRLWDADSGQEVLKLAGPVPQTLAVRFSPDGRILTAVGGTTDPASRARPGEVRTWDAGRPRPGISLTGHTSPIETVWFSEDGSRLLAGGTEGRVLAWSLPDAQPLGAVADKPPQQAGRLAEDGAVGFRATACSDRTVYLVDLRPTDDDRQELRAVARPDAAWHAEQVRRYSNQGPPSQWPQPFAVAFHARQGLQIVPNDVACLRTLAVLGPWTATESRRRGDPAADEQERAARDLCARLAAACPTDPDCRRIVTDGLLAPDWLVLKPTVLTSTGGATLELLPDGAIRAGGKNPDHDTYILTVASPPGRLTGFRLEVLPDPVRKNLPGRAPENGNFELSEFTVAFTAPGPEARPAPVSLASAWCDYGAPASQHYLKKDMRIEWAIDGDSKTVWNTFPSLTVPHTAVFPAREPVASPVGGTLTLRLDFQGPNARHALGYFRLAAATSPRPAVVERWRNTLAGRQASALTVVAAAAYLRGDWQVVTAACTRAAEVQAGGSAFDAGLVAVARGRLGEQDLCREALARARSQASREPPDTLLAEILSEAEGLLGDGPGGLP